VRLSRKLPLLSGKKVAVVVLIMACEGFAQHVIRAEETPCSEEIVHSNLELKEKLFVSGELKDPTGAPFSNSKVLLNTRDTKGNFVLYRSVVTGKDGHFDLGLVDAGQYRFLPAPNRGWKQPRQVGCTGQDRCEINLILQVNPTDLPFAACPIR
jgi:hypothetical protein